LANEIDKDAVILMELSGENIRFENIKAVV
jgi:hypothetical protein